MTYEELETVIRGYREDEVRLIDKHSKLIMGIAKRYEGFGCTEADLIAAGIRGLLAWEKKAETKDVDDRLYSMRTWYIRQEITRTVAKVREEKRKISKTLHNGE